MSKGSGRRPRRVSREEWDRNYERTFGGGRYTGRLYKAEPQRPIRWSVKERPDSWATSEGDSHEARKS